MDALFGVVGVLLGFACLAARSNPRVRSFGVLLVCISIGFILLGRLVVEVNWSYKTMWFSRAINCQIDIMERSLEDYNLDIIQMYLDENDKPNKKSFPSNIVEDTREVFRVLDESHN
jgi:hypothetical protein